MKNHQITKQEKKLRRRARTRAKIHGTAQRPRFCVSRSLKHLYVQLIDDDLGRTLLSVKDAEAQEPRDRQAGTSRRLVLARAVGELVAQKALVKKITTVVFDKGSYKYHGRIKAVAEGARSGGLKF